MQSPTYRRGQQTDPPASHGAGFTGHSAPRAARLRHGREQKLQALEELTIDLHRNEALMVSPAWHADILRELVLMGDKVGGGL